MEKLKPCPFCGSERIETNIITDTPQAYLKCRGCGIEQTIHSTEQDAIEDWNTRAKESERE